MTTLAAWLSVDSRRPSAIYLASDSRITWPQRGAWNRGRKLFISRTRPYLFAYCGEAFFPSQALGQLTERIDADLFRDSDPDESIHQISLAISEIITGQPAAASGDFEIVVAQRHGEVMSSTFHLHSVIFPRAAAPRIASHQLPEKSGLIGAWGSGARAFRILEQEWQESDVGGTSRAVFSAFADLLAAESDPSTAPPPQLVGLYRKGPGRVFGLIWEGRRYFYANEIDGPVETRNVQWHNALFEICDPATLKRALGAQPQPRPLQLPPRV